MVFDVASRSLNQLMLLQGHGNGQHQHLLLVQILHVSHRILVTLC